MTREEAKIFLLQLHTDKQLNKSEHEALRIAVKALEQEPCREADDYENEISDLYNRLDIVEYDKERLREEVTTLEEKLKGLSAEPCEDAISRAEVIDELNRIGRNAFKEDTDYDNFFAFLDNLPPVTPRPKTGVLEQKTCVTMRNLSDKELKHFVEEMKKVRPQVIRQEPCTDAISRQAVIDAIERWLECSGYNEAERHIMRAVQSVLHELPPVTPRLKMVTNTKEAETYPINEDISKGFEEFTKMMFKQGQVESEE